MESQKNENTVRWPALAVALLLLALELALVVRRMQPPAPLPADAAPDVFSAGRAQAIVEDLLAEQVPHPVGSTENDRVRERIVGYLEDLGYEVEIQQTWSCRGHEGGVVCAFVRNIVTQLPGQEDGLAVMVVAHYDSVHAGPGVADDSSNVAAMLEMARILQESGPYRNPIIFLFTDAEEIGLIGASGFAVEHPWMERVGVVLNLEARGTTGPGLMFETSVNNAWLLDVYARAVRRPATNSLLYEAYRIMPNDTDLSIFKAAGLPGMNFSYIGRPFHYHTVLDNLANLDWGSVQHQGESVLAIVQSLAQMDLADPPTGNAVYIDLLGWGLLRWPAAWTLPLGLLAVGLLLAALVVLLRRGRLKVRALLWGLLAALLALILPILLGLALVWLVGAVTGGLPPWPAYPLPLRVAWWASTLAGVVLVAILLARRAGTWGLGLGVWLVWAVLTLALSLTLVGAAVVVLVPLLCAALAIALSVFARLDRLPLAREGVWIVATLAAGWIWLQLALQFESALGTGMIVAAIFSLALCAITLLPLLALPPERSRLRWWGLAAVALTSVVAAIVATMVPPYSDYSPQQLSLYHVEDRDAETARWVAAADPAEVPDSLRALLDDNPVPVFPASERLYLVTDVSPVDEPSPELHLVAERRVGEEWLVQLHIHSPREARDIDVMIPLAGLAAVEVAGQTVELDEASAGDFYRLQCYGYDCEELDLALRFQTAQPVELVILDYAPGLPPDGDRFLQARPAAAVPGRFGDSTILFRRVRLEPGAGF